MMRKTIVAASLYLAGSIALFAQQEPPPTFRAGTTLVEVSIVALDEDGNPVADLRREEIVVTDRGQPREIVFFRFEGAPERHPAQPLPEGVYTNRFATAPNAARQVTAIVVDGVNTPPVGDGFRMRQASIREQIVRYLDSIPPHTRVAVYLLGRNVAQVHPFTDDVESVRASVAKMELFNTEKFAAPGHNSADSWEESYKRQPQSKGGSAEAAAGRAAAFAAEAAALSRYNVTVRDRRLALTVGGLEALGDHLAAIPGRKNIVWIGGGMPLEVKRAGFWTSWGETIRKSAEQLATQGIAVYPVMSQMSGDAVRRSLEVFADVTGGRLTLTLNDPTEGLRTTARDQRGTYSIGFYAEESEVQAWHPIDVRISRRGVTVRHRQGYLTHSRARETAEWTEDEWRAAIANPLGSSAVRLDGTFERANDAAAGAFDLRLQIALDDLNFRDEGGTSVAEVEIVTAEKIPNGDFAFRVERATLNLPPNAGPNPIARYARRLTLKPETTSIRLIVRDRATGRYGALDIGRLPD